MAADFRFVAHATERDADEFATSGLGDRLAERGLADAGRAYQAQDRARQLIGALLHGEILDDPFLDLLKAVMVGVEDLLGERKILLDLRLFIPRDRKQPIEIVAHDGGLRRHRRHLAKLFEFVLRLLARFLRELGVFDLLFSSASSSLPS